MSSCGHVGKYTLGLKFNIRLSISDFPFQWHLYDQKVILLIILYQQGFKNVFTSQTSGLSPTGLKLGHQIFGTVSDGPEVKTSNLRYRQS